MLAEQSGTVPKYFIGLDKSKHVPNGTFLGQRISKRCTLERRERTLMQSFGLRGLGILLIHSQATAEFFF